MGRELKRRGSRGTEGRTRLRFGGTQRAIWRSSHPFFKSDSQAAVTNRIINQLVGAGTSVGANYVEADDAVSKKEFLKSIGTCKKETREVKHFLRMAVRAVPSLKPTARKLWLEARELHLIFSKIWRSGKNK